MKKKLLKILIIIVIIIAIIVGAGIYAYVSSNTKQDVTMNNISGNYSSIVITDFETAKESLEDVIDDLGINSIDELEENTSNSNDSMNTYKFKQIYNGVEVYNASLIVYTDVDGNAEGVINNYKEISDIDVTPSHTAEELEETAIQSITDYGTPEIEDSTLIIYQLEDDEFVLAYKYEMNVDISVATVIIDDSTEEVLETIIPIYDLTESDISEYKVDSAMQNIATEFGYSDRS